MTSLVASFDGLLGHSSHTLTQGHELELASREAELIAQLGHVALRVGPRGKNKHNRHELVGFLEDFVVDQRGRLHIVVAQLVGDEALGGCDHPVRPDAADDEHLLEQIDLLLIATRHVYRLRGLGLVPVVPIIAILLHVLADVLDAVVKGLQELQVLPTRLREPRIGARLFGLLQRRVAFHVEVELPLVEVIVAVQDHGRHLEAEEQLMLFEDAHAGVVVHGLCHLLAEILETVVHDLVRLGVAERSVENTQVAAQGVFVHLADGDHARHGKVEDGAPLCNTHVEPSSLLDLLRSLGSSFQ
mmetsp:Transcript_82358/g.197575  ORF Transcript_82358/g.197575 Transcript_82358/m.197575 type:complete len:301 (-) Transcript_82358:431-1333(-)